MPGAGEITQAVLAMLTPLLPYLTKAGVLAAKSFTEAVGKAGGESAWKTAESLWKRLTGAATDDKKLNSTLSLVDADPHDADSIAMLGRVLQERLAKDEALRKELLQVLGGEAVVQRMLAERGSRISAAHQELQGTGEQEIIARDDSVIENATQSGRR
jgi:hypothetical protein